MFQIKIALIVIQGENYAKNVLSHTMFKETNNVYCNAKVVIFKTQIKEFVKNVILIVKNVKIQVQTVLFAIPRYF